jgi:trk system potassium uptake protein TrkA
MKVVIAGGGAVGTFIADELQQAGHTVDIIEQDVERAERARAKGEPHGVEWHAADACEVSSLREIGLEDADVVAAVTGDDEDNLVISLLAKQEFAVPRVVARVNNPKNEWLFNENWGVDVSVSTPHLLTALVEEAVSVGSLVRLLSFEGGRASLIEVTLATGSPAADRELAELDFPRDSTVVAVLRHDRVIVPRGDTRLLPGDEVLVLATDESMDQVREILTERPARNGAETAAAADSAETADTTDAAGADL